MSRNKRIWICLRVLVYIGVLSADVLDWRIRNASYACPSQDICGWGPKQGAKDMCCKGCSCDVDCKITNKCCFKGGINIKCIRTSYDTGFIQAYYMETSKPNILSAELPLDTNGEPCRDNQRPEWLQLLPVYSNSTRQIFMNSVCAEAHGLFDYEEATMSLLCGINSGIDDSGAQINAAMLSIQNNILPSRCSVHLHMPRIEYIQESWCDVNQIDQCSTEYINTKGDNHISKACTNDFHAVVFASQDNGNIRKFKNAFCAICNNYTVTTKSECMVGQQHTPDDTIDLPRQKFSLLVDMRNLAPFHQTGLPSRTKLYRACLERNDRLSMKTCRAILCPWGRIRDVTGACIWVSKFMSVERFQMTVKLTPTTAVNEADLNTSSLSNISSPWPRQWQVHVIEYTVDRVHSKLISNLFVELRMNESQTYLKQVINQAKSYSAKMWTLILNGTRVNFTSVISETNSRSNFDAARVLVYWKSTTPTMDIVTMVISSVHFCHLVELAMDEFTHYPNLSIIVSNLTGRQYNEGEFMMVPGNTDSGTSLARVCLNSSGFVDISIASRSGFIWSDCYWVIVVILWLILG